MLDEGLKVSAATYIRALGAREKMLAGLTKAMKGFDALALPTTILPAPRIEETTVTVGEDKMDVYIALGRLTLATSVLGLPSVSFPIGLSSGGLPMGAQLVGLPFTEGTILRIASLYESSVDGGFASFTPSFR